MIETERLLLRAWRESDREPFYQMCADPEVMRFFPSVLTREESDAIVDKINAQQEKRGFTLYAAELRERACFIGFIGLSVPSFMPAVEIGWRLARPYWNRGLATEGASAVLRHGFTDLGLSEIVSITVPTNLPSRRVMEKLGMTHRHADDFDHPAIPEGHPLRRHVLYRLGKRAYLNAQRTDPKPVSQ